MLSAKLHAADVELLVRAVQALDAREEVAALVALDVWRSVPLVPLEATWPGGLSADSR
jgi:hypothetical protein